MTGAFIYRNSHTGQVTELPARSARLDRLENWLLIGAPVDETDDGAADPEPPAEAERPSRPVAVARPSDNAAKAAWVAYAVACGMAEADAKALSKASLIEEFGGEDGED